METRFNTRAALRAAVLLAVFGTAIRAASSQPQRVVCASTSLSKSPPPVANRTSTPFVSSALAPTQCVLWSIPSSAVSAAFNYSPNGFVIFEFWRLQQNSSLDATQQIEGMYFIVSRGTEPTVTRIPNDSDTLTTRFSNDSNVDTDAVNYDRPYQRVVLPANMTSPNNNAAWYITVANLNNQNGGRAAPNGLTLAAYGLRISCAATLADVGCPQSDPAVSQPCNGHGRCVADPAAVPGVPSMACSCNSGFGDYDCNAPVISATPYLDNATNTAYYGQTSVQVTMDQWSDVYKITLPYVGPRSELLVEMTKFTPPLQGGGFNGYPYLVVKPVNTPDRNVPGVADIDDYSDVLGARFEQDYQFRMIRDLATESTLATGRNEFYVSVYNSRFPYNPGPGPSRIVNVSLTFRWATAAPRYATFICPGRGGQPCSGRGQCNDPYSPSAPRQSPNVGVTPAFTCTCLQGTGGTICDGSFDTSSILAVTTNRPDPPSHMLEPGQWDFYMLDLSSSKFNYATDQLAMQWTITDPLPGQPNALLTINSNTYPRMSMLDSPDGLKRGYLLYYWQLQGRGDPPAPFTIPGYRLTPGDRYYIGIYNSDYLQSSNFNYTFSAFIPSSSSTWLHPYMSVVLAVTAAIVLCLSLTLCRKLAQRRGVYCWPFLPRRRQQRAAIDLQTLISPPPGVPPAIVATFATYAYTASEDEKRALNKSVEDARPSVTNNPSALPMRSSAPTSATRAAATGVGAVAAAAPPLAQRGRSSSGLLGAAAAAPATAAGAEALAAATAEAERDGEFHRAVSISEEPACTVCLCEYEPGEQIRRLPCQHEFHMTCIDKWMASHTTCPVCRTLLAPEVNPTASVAAAAIAAGVPIVFRPYRPRSNPGVGSGLPQVRETSASVYGVPGQPANGDVESNAGSSAAQTRPNSARRPPAYSPGQLLGWLRRFPTRRQAAAEQSADTAARRLAEESWQNTYMQAGGDANGGRPIMYNAGQLQQQQQQLQLGYTPAGAGSGNGMAARERALQASGLLHYGQTYGSLTAPPSVAGLTGMQGTGTGLAPPPNAQGHAVASAPAAAAPSAGISPPGSSPPSATTPRSAAARASNQVAPARLPPMTLG